MAFCTNLRRRPSCSSLIPTLLAPAPSGLTLRESSLQTHDLSVPFQDPTSQGQRQLRVLILTTTSLTPPALDSTRARLEHFASLTGGSDIAILVPLFHGPASNHPDTSPLHALQTLNMHLLTTGPAIPVLPLAGPEHLPQLLRTYTSTLLRARAAHPVPVPNAYTDLLPLCTAHPPMSQAAHVWLSDRFACLKDVAGLGSRGDADAEVAALVAKGFAEREAWGLVRFWAEEVVLD